MEGYIRTTRQKDAIDIGMIKKKELEIDQLPESNPIMLAEDSLSQNSESPTTKKL